MNLKSTILNQPIQEKYQESHLEDLDSYPAQQINSDLLISVVIPVYNEENSIIDVIERIPNHLNYEIILVDDGSTDNSLEKVKDIRNRHIRVIQHKNNKGYGATILTGIKSATGDIIVTMDSDGQHCPEEIQKLVEPIINKQADIVIGSRYLGKCNYRIPSYTKIGENIISFFLWILFRQKVKNNQSGFKAFSKKSAKIFNSMLYNRFGLCTEVIYKAAYYKFNILEVPVSINLRKYGTSYVNLAKLFIAISTCILIYGVRKAINIFCK
jgi:glycosyltransferase involved in cell wall biosynthesis